MSDENPFVVQTLTGIYFDLSDPHNSVITMDDIAGSLAKICRFTGHTGVHYSVAQHSVHVSKLVEDETGDVHLALVALLHDAHEAYTGDISTPLKRLINQMAPGVLATIEDNISDAIFKYFGIFDWNPEMWKAADTKAYATECRDLMRKLSRRPLERDPETIVAVDCATAEIYFNQRFDDLLDQTGEW